MSFTMTQIPQFLLTTAYRNRGIEMKKIILSILATVLTFFLATFIIMPILSNWGYSSAEASYHLATHSFIFALIFIVIFCTLIIIEKIDELKDK